MEVDECPSKENLFGQSELLMNATYIAFPSGEGIHGIIIASEIKSYNSVITLHETATNKLEKDNNDPMQGCCIRFIMFHKFSQSS